MLGCPEGRKKKKRAGPGGAGAGESVRSGPARPGPAALPGLPGSCRRALPREQRMGKLRNAIPDNEADPPTGTDWGFRTVPNDKGTVSITLSYGETNARQLLFSFLKLGPDPLSTLVLYT